MNKQTQSRAGIASIVAGILAVIATMLTRQHSTRPVTPPTVTTETVTPTPPPAIEAPPPEPTTATTETEPPPVVTKPEPEPPQKPEPKAPVRTYPGPDQALTDAFSGNELLDGTPLVLQWNGEWYDVTVHAGQIALPDEPLIGTDWCLTPAGSRDQCPNMHTVQIHQTVNVREGP